VLAAGVRLRAAARVPAAQPLLMTHRLGLFPLISVRALVGPRPAYTRKRIRNQVTVGAGMPV
jgi:hypothetical protein